LDAQIGYTCTHAQRYEQVSWGIVTTKIMGIRISPSLCVGFKPF
jgi:hypothetical protein